MNTLINMQNICKNTPTPTKKQFTTWVNKAIAPRKKKLEITIRIVGTKEISKLNKIYRKKNKPTNIISFEFNDPANTQNHKYLGDLVICAPIVRKEAEQQNKTFVSHWAHLTIHGVLHLLGSDHKNANDAKKMEQLEIKLLKQLGFGNPY